MERNQQMQNVMAELKVSVHWMVTVNKMMLSTNASSPPVLTQRECTLGRQKNSSKSDIITIISL